MKILRIDGDRGKAMIVRRIDKIITRLECCNYSEVTIPDDLETKRYVVLAVILKWFRGRPAPLLDRLREKGL